MVETNERGNEAELAGPRYRFQKRSRLGPYYHYGSFMYYAGMHAACLLASFLPSFLFSLPSFLPSFLLSFLPSFLSFFLRQGFSLLWNSQRSTCLCLLSAGITSLHYYHPAILCFLSDDVVFLHMYPVFRKASSFPFILASFMCLSWCLWDLSLYPAIGLVNSQDSCCGQRLHCGWSLLIAVLLLDITRFLSRNSLVESLFHKPCSVRRNPVHPVTEDKVTGA